MKNSSIQLVTNKQAKRLLSVQPGATYMIVVNLALAPWVISEEERLLFENSMAPHGYKWLIVEHGSEEAVYESLK